MQSTASDWEVNLLAFVLLMSPPWVPACCAPSFGEAPHALHSDFCWVMLSPLLVLLVLMDWFLPLERYVLC